MVCVCCKKLKPRGEAASKRRCKKGKCRTFKTKNSMESTQQETKNSMESTQQEKMNKKIKSVTGSPRQFHRKAKGIFWQDEFGGYVNDESSCVVTHLNEASVLNICPCGRHCHCPQVKAQCNRESPNSRLLVMDAYPSKSSKIVKHSCTISHMCRAGTNRTSPTLLSTSPGPAVLGSLCVDADAGVKTTSVS